MIRRSLQAWHTFHRKEEGMTTLQKVAILAVAAIVLSVLKIFWADIFNWFVANAGQTSDGWAGQE